MSEQQAEGVSKSAKRRAAKKARDSAAAEEPATPEPQPQPKAKAKTKAEPQKPPAAEPKAEPKAKAKGKAKAEPKAEPKAAPKAEPKAKAKAAAAKAEPKAAAAPKAEPKQAAAPKAAAAKQQPKAAAKKAAAKPVEEEPEAKESAELPPNWVVDDGSGGGWDVSTGVSKKQQKRKERIEQEEKEMKATGFKPGAPVQYIPGMAPTGAATQAAGKGSSQAVSADVARILAMKGQAVEEKAPEGISSTVTIRVPEKKIGIVIGPKGAKIKLIQEKTGVSNIDTTGEIFTIVGKPQAVAEAEKAIRELIDKGYCSIQYDDFSENFVNVHPSCIPDIVGKEGKVIRKIKEELGVEVNIPQLPPGHSMSSSKKFKVGLAGTAPNVEKAKQCINDIMTYSHSEITHPGVVHEELDIEAWSHRYIIGTKGSEMKHIQNNYKVRVNIPREHSLNQMVCVVGEPKDVERAKLYIEKVIWNAQNQSRGRDKVEDGDVWGEEGEEEDWMKQYIYKR